MAVGQAVALAAVVAACGAERSFDNPPDISPQPLVTVTAATTVPTTTVFVPSTAPTTLAPPTQPPPPEPEPEPAPPPPAPAPTAPLPTSATTTPATIPDRYTVVLGDTLFGIAQRVNVSLDALLAANGMTASSLIVPGQELAVPAGGSVPQAPQPTQAPTPTQATSAPQPTQAPAPTQPATTVTLAPVANLVAPGETSASCQAPDSADASGAAVSFNPGNLLDRNPGTAWRCAQGSDQSVTFQFGGPTHLTSVGLINGYAKVDPVTGVDRYLQNARVRQARWVFSDGTTVVQDFADGTRSVQSIAVDVTASSVTLEIVSTYPPGGEAPRDFVPVAEVELIGGPGGGGGDAAPAEAPEAPAAPAVASPGLAGATAAATCEAPGSATADGTPVTFSPANVLDGDPGTAWRCPAPATGETLTVALAGPMSLSSVGLVNGYAKVDSLTGVDRYLQNHRVRQVRWSFDDGSSVIQDFQDGVREAQTTAVDVVTATVTIEVLATYPPAVDPAEARDMVPVGDVVIEGVNA